MASKKKILQGYRFQDDKEYARAKKEWELIAKIKKNTDVSNVKTAIRIYDKAVSNNTFHTVIGYSFLKELQDMVLRQEAANAESLKPITIVGKDKGYVPPDAGELKKYKTLYGKGKADIKKLKIVIGLFVILILGIFVITYKTQYSVFTYFTDYETEIENRVIREYSDWRTQLEEKEKELDEREEKLFPKQ